MAPANVFFDVWVNGPSQPPDLPARRTELLRRIEAVHPVARPDGAQFVAGGRLRLRRGIDQDAALRTVDELQKLGVAVEVEPNRPPEEAILALDAFPVAEPESHSGPVLDESLMARLASIDGEDTQAKTKLHVDRSAATVNDPSLAKPRPLDADADDDARFRPPSEIKSMELEIEQPVRPKPAPPPVEAEPYPTMADAPTTPMDVRASAGGPARSGGGSARPSGGPGARPGAHGPARPEPEEPWQPVPGRLANGALRQRPPVRIAIGIIAGLLLGWLLAQPYARRVERHVAELHAEADRERYRPVDEAQARVRQLDNQADDAQTTGGLVTALIWLTVGGAAFAGWWRLT